MRHISNIDKKKYIRMILIISLFISLSCMGYEFYFHKLSHNFILASLGALLVGNLILLINKVSTNLILNTLISSSLLLISADAYVNGGLNSRLLLWLLVISFFSSATPNLKMPIFG